MYWKVVHLNWPEVVEGLPVDNGYAVCSIRTELLIVPSYNVCGHTSIITNPVVVRYSGFELLHHALVHCNNLNIWEIDTEDRRLWPLIMVNSEFLYDAV